MPMVEKELVIQNKLGLHARPAALFVQTTTQYQSRVRVMRDDQEIDGKSIMGVMMLAAEYGSELRILAEGPDAIKAVSALVKEFDRKFGE